LQKLAEVGELAISGLDKSIKWWISGYPTNQKILQIIDNLTKNIFAGQLSNSSWLAQCCYKESHVPS
jgi:hypothetical protein